MSTKETISGNPPELGKEHGTPTDKKKENGQYEDYWVLSKEERKKGFVRPLRTAYKHVGKDLDTSKMRELTDEEKERFADKNYVGFIPNEDEDSAVVGRYVTEKDLESGCDHVTIISKKIAETYARDPKFYGSTFCCGCQEHLPVEEFVWTETDIRVGE